MRLYATSQASIQCSQGMWSLNNPMQQRVGWMCVCVWVGCGGGCGVGVCVCGVGVCVWCGWGWVVDVWGCSVCVCGVWGQGCVRDCVTIYYTLPLFSSTHCCILTQLICLYHSWLIPLLISCKRIVVILCEQNIWAFIVFSSTLNILKILISLLFSIPLSYEECDSSDIGGRDYRGYTSESSTGKTCQKWTSQEPHNHLMMSRYPNTGLGDHNFCRSPDNNPLGPWCYTLDTETRWQYCNKAVSCKRCIHQNLLVYDACKGELCAVSWL